MEVNRKNSQNFIYYQNRAISEMIVRSDNTERNNRQMLHLLISFKLILYQ